jgi:hypothetical protein
MGKWMTRLNDKINDRINDQINARAHTLSLKSGKVIEFDGFLRNHLMTDDLHICVLENHNKKALITFNEEGEILWSRILSNDYSIAREIGKEKDHIIINGLDNERERLNPYSGEKLFVV